MLVRPVDSHYTRANIAKGRAALGWQPHASCEDLIRSMVDAGGGEPDGAGTLGRSNQHA
jgi:nucleoside-diphosphate-sugar epimerase